MADIEFNKDKFMEAYGPEFEAIQKGRDLALDILKNASEQVETHLTSEAALRVEFQDGYSGWFTEGMERPGQGDSKLFEYGLQFRSLILGIIPIDSELRDRRYHYHDFNKFVSILLVQLLFPPSEQESAPLV